MASLEGKKPANTFKDLLQVSNSNAGIDGTLRDLQDGEGTVGPVKISTGTLQVPSGKTLDIASGGTFDAAGATVTGIGGWELIELITVSSSTSAALFSTGIDTDYDKFMLDCINVRVVASADELQLRVRESGGAVVSTATYATITQRLDAAAGAAAIEAGSGSAVTAMLIGHDLSPDATNVYNGTVFAYAPASTGGRRLFTWDYMSFNSNGELRQGRGGGAYNATATALDALQVLAPSGILAATLRLYGLRKT